MSSSPSDTTIAFEHAHVLQCLMTPQRATTDSSRTFPSPTEIAAQITKLPSPQREILESKAGSSKSDGQTDKEEPPSSNFAPHRQWTGADGDTSFPISERHTGWIYADTLMGTWQRSSATPETYAGFVMPHASFGLWDNETHKMTFFAGDSNSGFMRPPWLDGFNFAEQILKPFFWPTAAAVTEPDPDNSNVRSVVLLGVKVILVGTGNFDFQCTETWAVCLSSETIAKNPTNPYAWRQDWSQMPQPPHPEGELAAVAAFAGSKTTSGDGKAWLSPTWNCGALVVPQSQKNEDATRRSASPYVYLFGRLTVLDGASDDERAKLLAAATSTAAAAQQHNEKKRPRDDCCVAESKATSPSSAAGTTSSSDGTGGNHDLVKEGSFRQVVARIPLDALIKYSGSNGSGGEKYTPDWDQCEVLMAASGGGGADPAEAGTWCSLKHTFTNAPATARALWPAPTIPEFTPRFSTTLGKFVVPYIEFLGTNILVRVADRIEGPWESLKNVKYALPYPFSDNARIFSYALKLHPSYDKYALPPRFGDGASSVQEQAGGAKEEKELMMLAFVSNGWKSSFLNAPGADGVLLPFFVTMSITA